MTFLAAASSKTLLKMQKSQLTYQSQVLFFRMNAMNREARRIESYYDSCEDGSQDLEDDMYYQQLKEASETIEMQKSAIDDQAALIEQEINALKTLTEQGIKSACTLSLSGGS